MHEEVHETSTDSGLDDSLNLIVRTVGEVGDRPASVDEDLIVERVNELGENGESW